VEKDTKIKENAERFWHLVYLTESEYHKHRLFEAHGRKLAMWDVLDVSEKLFAWREGEVLLSMPKIRGTFQEHPWLDQKNDKALRRIMEEGKVECMLCRGENEQLDSGMCTPGFTKKDHAAQHASVDQKTKQAQEVAVAAENANKPVLAAIAAKVLPIGCYASRR
jgi:hypothetical protein